MRRVAVLDPEESAGGLPPRRLRRLGGSDLVITTHAVGHRRLVAAGVAAIHLPSAARLPATVVGDAQRQAARRSLDLAEAVPVLGVAGPLGGSGRGRDAPTASLVEVTADAGWVAVQVRGDGCGDDELCVAACDAVVMESLCPDGSPPRGALVAAAGGAALVGIRSDLEGLVGDDVSVAVDDVDMLAHLLRRWRGSTDAVGALPSRPQTAEAVRRRFSLAEVGDAWVRAVRGDPTDR